MQSVVTGHALNTLEWEMKITSGGGKDTVAVAKTSDSW